MPMERLREVLARLGKRNYVLDADGNPVPEPDLARWGQWMEECAVQRIVARDEIGDALVATDFLGIDHGWFDEAPVLWETMVFGKRDKDGERPVWRYTSLKAAIAGHARVVRRLRRGA